MGVVWLVTRGSLHFSGLCFLCLLASILSLQHLPFQVEQEVYKIRTLFRNPLSIIHCIKDAAWLVEVLSPLYLS